MAIGAIKAAQQKGFAVPRDISVVGFDDIKPSSEIAPSLTTIRQPIKEIGSLGAKFLMSESDNKDESVKRLLPVSLIQRGSSALRLA
jgi:LacI family transcriptional regulator